MPADRIALTIVGPDGRAVGCDGVLVRDGARWDMSCKLLPLVEAIGVEAAVVEETRHESHWDDGAQTSSEECVKGRAIAVAGKIIRFLRADEEIGLDTRCHPHRVLEAAGHDWWQSICGTRIRVKPIRRLEGNGPLHVLIPTVDRVMLAEKMSDAKDPAPVDVVARKYDGLHTRLMREKVLRLCEEWGADIADVVVATGDRYEVTGGPDVVGGSKDLFRADIYLNVAMDSTEAFYFPEMMKAIGHDVVPKSYWTNKRRRERRRLQREEQEQWAQAVADEECRLRFERQNGGPLRVLPCEEEGFGCSRDCPLWPPRKTQ